MVADADAALVVTRGHLDHLLPPTTRRMTVGPGEIPVGPAPAATPTHPDDVAAVIATSGSTGVPKSVQVTHRALLARTAWSAEEWQPNADDVGCMKTPIAFVDALCELLEGLLHGVPTVVVPDDDARDPLALCGHLAANGVTRLLLVPTLLRMLLSVPDLSERLPRLNRCISSGEPLPVELAETFRRRLPGRALHNVYGAAEAWDALGAPARGGAGDPDDGSGVVAAGHPLPDVDVHVLDRAGHVAPVGVPGELYVGGACLARGYLGRPDLTAERFVPHPFARGRRLYRTGDRGRIGPDGDLTLLGRVDHVVKVRGARVDPAEVERVLVRIKGVRQACVVGRPGRDGSPELAAYVVASVSEEAGRPKGLSAERLRRLLPEHLPPHLVPSSVTVLPALPLTTTGKVDRGALPAPAAATTPGGDEPGTEAERLVASAWEKALGVDGVGLHDDFFDLGGHSLLAAQLAAHLARVLRRELPLQFVFEHPTVHRMALAVDGRAAVGR